MKKLSEKELLSVIGGQNQNVVVIKLNENEFECLTPAQEMSSSHSCGGGKAPENKKKK
jgi:bacteriocin-like protein